MHKKNINILVLCPQGATLDKKVAGLTLEERLGFALQYGGAQKVAFIGQGTHPSIGDSLQKVTAEELFSNPDDEVLTLSSDLIFDRNQLGDAALRTTGAIELIQKDELTAIQNDPQATIEKLGLGSPESGPGYAIRVTDGLSAKQANKMLLHSLVKPVDGFISRHLNRKISLAISNLLVRTPLKPNQVTVAIMSLGLASGVFAYFAEFWWSLVIASLLFQGQSVLDGCDGEIARLKYHFSVKGQWLDTIGDDLTNYAFCLGLGLGQARLLDSSLLFGFSWFLLLVQLYASGIMYQRIYKMNTGDLLAIPNLVSSGEPKGKMGRFVRIIHTMTKRDCFAFITSVIVAIQLPLVSFLIIALGSFIMAPSLTLNEIRIRKAIKNNTLPV